MKGLSLIWSSCIGIGVALFVFPFVQVSIVNSLGIEAVGDVNFSSITVISQLCSGMALILLGIFKNNKGKENKNETSS